MPSSRLIFTDHGRYPSEGLIDRFVQGWSATKIDCLVAVSASLATHVQAFLRLKQPPVVVENGIDLSPFSRLTDKRRRVLRAEWGFRDDDVVVAFTATQIPHISDRRYPASLAGKLYPDGIPIHPEEKLVELVRTLKVEEVVFAYSDVSYAYLDERKKIVEKAGARFSTFDVDRTMLASSKQARAAYCATVLGQMKRFCARRSSAGTSTSGTTSLPRRLPVMLKYLEKLLTLTTWSSMASAVWPKVSS